MKTWLAICWTFDNIPVNVVYCAKAVLLCQVHSQYLSCTASVY